MTKLFLHIGSHKTGSSSIQKACRFSLSGPPAKVSYINIRPSGTRILYSSGKLETFRVNLDLKKVDSVFRPVPDRCGQTTGPEIHIASDEELFWINDAEQIYQLSEILVPRYESIIVICYLRRQDLLALSHRKQVIEGTPATRFYGAEAKPLPDVRPHFYTYFDYAKKLTEIWAPSFGKENIRVIPFEREAMADGDAVSEFARQTGVGFRSVGTVTTNQSLAGNRTLVGLKLAEMGIPPRQRKMLVEQLSGKGLFLPTQAEAEKFMAHFTEANNRLSREWTWQGKPLRFNESFDMYPELPEPLWSNQDVENMLRAALSAKLGK